MSSTVAPNTGHPHAGEMFIRAPLITNVTDLGASSANTLTIPVGAPYLRLAGNLDFYVCWGSTAVSTSGAITNGSGSELVPVQSGGIFRNIGSTNGTTSISVMSTAACHLTQSWWAP